MSSNSSTLVKCPPKNKIMLSEIFKDLYRTIQKGQILKDKLVRTKLSKRLFRLDMDWRGIPESWD